MKVINSLKKNFTTNLFTNGKLQFVMLKISMFYNTIS